MLVFSSRTNFRAVGISKTGYGLDGRGVGVRVLVGVRFFYSPRRLHGFWSPTSLLSNWGDSCLTGKAPGA
jgi:hypothetical protein